MNNDMIARALALSMSGSAQAAAARAAAAEAQEVLASIPEDYTELSAQVTENTGDINDLKSATNDLTARVDDMYPIATVSGSIANAPEAAQANAEKLVIGINPVQDLHGYDAPWPAGGGKNMLDVTSMTQAKTNGDITVTPNGDGTFALSGTAEQADINIWLLGNYDSQEPLFTLPAGTYTVTNVRLFDYHSGLGITTPINGSAQYTFSEDQPITAVRVGQAVQGTDYTGTTLKPQIEKASSATPWTPYSNICPISGWTGANVSRTGKNLCPLATMDTTNGGYINGSTGEVGHVLAGQTYTLSLTNKSNSTANVTVRMVVNGSWKNQTTGNLKTSDRTTWTFTATDEGDISLSAGLGTDYSPAFEDIQLELGSTATEYEPYAGTNIPISWQTEAGTVYGGTLDVTSGVLTATHALRTYDGSDDENISLGWEYNGSTFMSNIFILPNADIKKSAAHDVSDLKANWARPFIKDDSAYLDEWTCRRRNDQTQILLYTPSSTTDTITLARLKTMLEDTPLQLFYELATPITYQLTPQEVALLRGDNNVWADTGDGALTYRQDVGLLLQRLISQVAALNSAVANS